MVLATLTQNNTIQNDDADIQEMIETGVHLGHSKNKRHPAMEPFIWTTKGGISIIDVTKTKDKLALAMAFLKSVSAKKGLVLFVGTRPSARNALVETARSVGMPYVSERWIGGTLTNFKVITKRVETLVSLEQKLSSGELGKYTKKERLLFEKEIGRLKDNFDGLRLMNRIPDALFVVNVPHDLIAVKEARLMRIPVVALSDTNSDPKAVSYSIPSNDDAISVVSYMLAKVKMAIEEGRKEVDQGEVKNNQ